MAREEEVERKRERERGREKKGASMRQRKTDRVGEQTGY